MAEGESTILAAIDLFTCIVTALLEGNDPKTASNLCDASLATLESVKAASTTVVGSSSTGSTANLAAGLVAYGIPGFTVTSFSVTSSTGSTE